MMRRMLSIGVAPLVPRIQGRTTGCLGGGGDSRDGGRPGKSEASKGCYSGSHFDNIVSNMNVDTEGLRAPLNNVKKKSHSGFAKSKLFFQDTPEGELSDNGNGAGVDGRLAIERLKECRRNERFLSRMKKYDTVDQPKGRAFVLTNTFSNGHIMENVKTGVSDNDEDVTRIYSYNEVEPKDRRPRSKDEDTAPTRPSVSKSLLSDCVEGCKKAREQGVKRGHRGEAVTLECVDAECEHHSEWKTANSSGNDGVAEAWAGGPRTNKESNRGAEENVNVARLREEGHDAGDNEFTCDLGGISNRFGRIRNHPFFEGLLRRVEKNALRRRQQIRATGRYNLEAVNLCVRPLLQLMDYPFTLEELHQMAPFIYTNFLRDSLSDLKACYHLNLYHSIDTGVILDWSMEDFLRRRYESIHLSWEPVNIVIMRFGWDSEIMSDRDCLLFFSKFLDYIELAQLELSAGDEKPRAIAIEDPVRMAERRPVPVSRLLVRRKPTDETEPSITEAIRLMGTPALWSSSRSKKSGSVDKNSVEGVFECIQREAANVDGDTSSKLRHGVEVVAPLGQASNPSGRSIRDFSLGKTRTTMITDAVPRSFSVVGGKPFDGDHRAYTPELYEALNSAYHKKKVETTLLRRRLLATNNIGCASELQGKLVGMQKDLSRLRERLEKMRRLRRAEESGYEPPISLHSEKSGYVGATQWMEGEECTLAEVSPSQSVRNNGFSVDDKSVSTPTNQLDSTKQNNDEQTEKNGDDAGDSAREEDSPSSPGGATKGTMNMVQVCPSGDREELYSLSSAAVQLKMEIELTRERHKHEEEKLMKKMDEALVTLAKIEKTMRNFSEREKETEARETEEEERHAEVERKEEAARVRREEAEARARAMEEELLRKHEERMKLLNMRRERAQQAQRDAELELERQKREEQKALEAEAELQRRLNEAKSMIWSDRTTEKIPIANQIGHEGREECADVTQEDPTVDASHPASSGGSKHVTSPALPADRQSSTEFSCTPEQYDGLHMASNRLRKEIAELERQMDVKGDEDDMTLMAVLAVSRAELEELEEFIRAVQLREPWAAKRDRLRKEEEMREAKSRGGMPCDLQEKINEIRFQISLMEKRLQHATERRVITKLEQGIINGRREINRLRVEQDRLRRSGKAADAGGIQVPPLVSVAEALAEIEGAEIGGSAVVNDLYGGALEAPTVVRVSDRNSSVNETDCRQPAGGTGSVNSISCISDKISDDAPRSAESALKDDEKELQQLMVRLKEVLADIKQLEGRLDEQEDENDAEATAESLAQLQEKLQQLLEMREALKSRTEQTSSKGKSESTGAPFNESQENPVMRVPVVLTPLPGRPISGYVQVADAVAESLGAGERQPSVTTGRKKPQKARSKKARC